MVKIQIEKEKCIDCGACTGVCETGAIFLDKVKWLLAYDHKKCTGCCLCIKACPLRAITAVVDIASQAVV